LFNFAITLLNKMKAAVIRREHFNAAHRLHNPNWSDEKNLEVFGKCNNSYFHGHNYELETIVIGEIDPETGYVIDTKLLSALVKEHVLDVFDHKNLNAEVSHFENLNPTAENIAQVIYNILKPLLSNHLNLKIRLYETPRNFVEFPY
jgi:6-pyruvoyltetrahydropterin/6-carboxytetrahydropterin synthase